MSSLLGKPGDRWTLANAVDALADAARRAGVPAWVWLVGLCYPGLNLSVGLVRSFLGVLERATSLDVPGASGAGDLLFLLGPRAAVIEGHSAGTVTAYALFFLPLYVLLYRFIVGLAKVSDPGAWRARAAEGATERVVSGVPPLPPAPRLGAVWEAGRGAGFPACGMWLILSGLLIGVTLFLLGPLVMLVHLFDIETLNPLLVGLLLPLLGLVLAYATVLHVLNQLALHSLAHNRRGVASALTHAWRLVRGSPWSATRAMLVDFVLFLLILAASGVLVRAFGRADTAAGFVASLVQLALHGFAGVTRASYWARTYRALGGLSAADHVPGLA